MREQFWRLQKAANLSNSQAAEYLGVNISTIKRYRNGEINPPRAVMIALECKSKGLVTDQGEYYGRQARG